MRDIPAGSLQAGERIVGDLKKLGWIVVRGVRMNPQQRTGIRDIANMGNKRTGGTWHCIENEHKNYKKKYNHNSTLHKQWDVGAVKRYTEMILATVISKTLPSNYLIRGKNIIKISGKVESDQRLHTDYPERTRV